MQDITDDGAGRACHDADHRRHARDRLLAFRVEQPLGGKTAAALLKLFQHRAFAGHFHRLHDNLVFRAPAIDRQLAGDDHLQPFLGLHAKRPGDHFPADTVKRVPLILQGKIEMAGGGPRRTRDFRPDPHEIELAFDGGLEPLRKLGDGQEGRCVGACLFGRAAGRAGTVFLHGLDPFLTCPILCHIAPWASHPARHSP